MKDVRIVQPRDCAFCAVVAQVQASHGLKLRAAVLGIFVKGLAVNENTAIDVCGPCAVLLRETVLAHNAERAQGSTPAPASRSLDS